MIKEEVKILTAKSAHSLTSTANALIKEGWKRQGSHQVVVIHEQGVFAGKQHMETRNTLEYSITMVREYDTELTEYKPQNQQ